jgi:hypothetical protein
MEYPEASKETDLTNPGTTLLTMTTSVFIARLLSLSVKILP